VNDEQETIANHEWQTSPEFLVRNHVRNTLNTLNLPCNDHTNDKVCNETDKKKDENNDGKHFTTISIINLLTTTSLALDDNFDSATIAGDFEIRDSFFSTANDVDLSRGTGTAWAVFTPRVGDSHTLIGSITIQINKGHFLGLEITIAHSGPKTRALADRGSRRALSGSITTDVDVSEITSGAHVIETVRELRLMIKRSQIISPFLAMGLIKDNSRAVISLSCDKGSHKQRDKGNGKTLHDR